MKIIRFQWCYLSIAAGLLLVLNSCETESILEDQIINKNDISTESRATKINVCHFAKSDNFWNVISISSNALSAHLQHGDVQLIDSDGDGYVEQINECMPGGDCNDMDAEINPGMIEICGNGIDDNCDGQIDEECGEGIAYSLRKFFGWSNAVLKIRRSSDNATAYLFFDGASSSDLITTSSYISTSSNTTPDTSPNVTLATWIGSNDGFVEEWIAQETDGNINDNHTPFQTATTAQPKIVSAGAIVTDSDNSLPAVDFDGGDHLVIRDVDDPDNHILLLDNGNEFTIYTVSSNDTSNSIGAIFCNNNSSSRRIGIFNERRTSETRRVCVASTAAGNHWVNLLNVENIGSPKLLTLTVDASKELEGYSNNTLQDNLSFTGTYNNDAIRIGAQHGAQSKFKGIIQEIWIIAAEETSKHSNINTYYSIY